MKAFFANRWVKWPLIILFSVILLFIATLYIFTTTIGWGMAPWKLEPIRESGHPHFITHNYIDLERIYTISKFRSSAGHDASDSFETCRSMKHYFGYSSQDPDPSTIKIYAPATGKVAFIFSDAPGKEVWIRPDAAPQYLIEMFHVVPNDDIKIGSRITSGQIIGHHVSKETQSDMLISMHGLFKHKHISYFEVITDEVFTQYQALGIERREDFIVSKEERDNKPLQCAWSPTKTGLFKNEEPRSESYITLRKEQHVQPPADSSSPPPGYDMEPDPLAPTPGELFPNGQ
jgi:hypothetical protein